MAAIEPEQVALYSLSRTKKYRIYNPGVKFDIEKRMSVKGSYQRCKKANGGLQRNLTQGARNCNVRVSTMTLLEFIQVGPIVISI
jgi:hypothetical protein